MRGEARLEEPFNIERGGASRGRPLPSKKSLHIESSGQLCIYCGACVGICPLNCIYLDETRITFDEKICTRCEICVKACPVGAIEIG
jgi:ferredoxin